MPSGLFANSLPPLCNAMDVTILCRVVDNFGDIGFVYRLCRSLSQKAPSLSLRIVTDNLHSFSLLEPEVKENLTFQKINSWKVIDWNASEENTIEFTKNEPEIILECFQCGRPEWLDEILFSPSRERIVKIINIDYLTAEDWADDFHLLKGATRSTLVKKINFFPGFTNKTGGMVLDQPFISFVKNPETALAELKGKLPDADLSLLMPENKSKDEMNIVMFSYPRDFSDIIKAFSLLEKKVNVFLAGGAGHDSFMQAYKNTAAVFTLVELPFLPQSAWDALLTLTDFSFIRGEDSFSRACLSGIPFVWHAYEQEENVHMEKVNAFLNRVRQYSPSLGEEDFLLYKKIMLYYNLRDKKSPSEQDDFSQTLCLLLNKTHVLKKVFSEFSNRLFSNGDLTEKLLPLLQ